MFQQTVDRIFNLIAKNKIKKAIKELKILLKKSDRFEEVIIQSARFSDLKKQIRIGKLSHDEINQQKTKISFALVDMLSEISEEIENDEDLKKEIEQKSHQNNSTQIHKGKGDIVIGNKNSFHHNR